MKLAILTAMALTLSPLVPAPSYAADQTQDRTRLQECGELNEQDCAELLRIRDRLRDCDGVVSEECTLLLRERDRLQACADGDQDRDRDRDRDQDRDRDRDQSCEPASGGSGNN